MINKFIQEAFVNFIYNIFFIIFYFETYIFIYLLLF